MDPELMAGMMSAMMQMTVAMPAAMAGGAEAMAGSDNN